MKDKKNISKYINTITYIILIVIIISLLIDKNMIIGKEKQTVKEMTQSELESSLNDTIQQLNEAQTKYAADVQTYKKQIAEAVTNQGIETTENDEGSVIAENIGKILSTKTQATATAAQILTGETAWVNGAPVTGTMVDNGAVNETLNAGGSYTIPSGYHNGSGKVTVNSLESQTSATATESDISSGKTAWVNGTQITGTGTSAKRIVKLGTGTSFDCSAYEGYENFTKDNFLFVPNSLGSTRGNTITYDGGMSISVQYTFSYSYSAPKLSITSNIYGSAGGSKSVTVNAYPSITAYLIY